MTRQIMRSWSASSIARYSNGVGMAPSLAYLLAYTRARKRPKAMTPASIPAIARLNDSSPASSRKLKRKKEPKKWRLSTAHDDSMAAVMIERPRESVQRLRSEERRVGK